MSRRSTEADDLLRRVEASQMTVELAERKLSSMQQYVRPVLSSAGASSPTGVGLTELVAGVGAQGAVQVSQERAAVERTTILPWHSAALSARTAYAGYLDAKAAHLASAGSGDRRSDEGERLVDQARADAVSALQALVSTEDGARVEAALTGPWS